MKEEIIDADQHILDARNDLFNQPLEASGSY
jgi:hypothetical protein